MSTIKITKSRLLETIRSVLMEMIPGDPGAEMHSAADDAAWDNPGFGSAGLTRAERSGATASKTFGHGQGEFHPKGKLSADPENFHASFDVLDISNDPTEEFDAVPEFASSVFEPAAKVELDSPLDTDLV